MNLIANRTSIDFRRLTKQAADRGGGESSMKHLLRNVALLGLAIAVCAPAIAQDAAAPARGRRGQGQGRGGRGRVSAATMPMNLLTAVLKLKDDQKTKIGEIQTKLKEDVKTATGDQPKLRELNTKAVADIDAILTDEQKTMLKEALPALGLIQQSRAIPLVVLPDLKLTDEQKTKIKDLAKETQDKITALPQAERQTGRMPIVAEFKTKLEALLTDEQKKTIVEKTPKPAAAPPTI